LCWKAARRRRKPRPLRSDHANRPPSGSNADRSACRTGFKRRPERPAYAPRPVLPVTRVSAVDRSALSRLPRSWPRAHSAGRSRRKCRLPVYPPSTDSRYRAAAGRPVAMYPNDPSPRDVYS
jgi:hypothetical protein